MPFYKTALDRIQMNQGDEVHQRTCRNLLALRKAFHGESDAPNPEKFTIPDKTDGRLLLATWNLREFDSQAFGKRSIKALLYIAEIISRFDLVAVQEVRRSLGALDRLQQILGDGWQYIVTDLVQYRTGGNFERMAYLFDTRTVKFRGLAGELNLKPAKRPSGGYYSFRFARDPFVVGFRSEWFKFCLVTVHILWGKSTANYPPRVREIEAVADAVHDRASSSYA